MSERTLREELVQIVHDYEYVSFRELTGRFFASETGSLSLELDGYENLLVWANVSADLIEAINEALERKEVFLGPASDLTYLTDGGGLNLPEAKKLQSYKSPHWVKMVLQRTPA